MLTVVQEKEKEKEKQKEWRSDFRESERNMSAYFCRLKELKFIPQPEGVMFVLLRLKVIMRRGNK